MFDLIKKMMAPVERRVMNLVARGKVTVINDGTKTQTLQADLLADETQDGLERFQNYGFTSNPPTGAECLVLFVGGNRDHGIVVMVNDGTTRKKELEPGDVAIYTHQGGYIHLEADSGDITIKANDGGKLRLEADDIEIHANNNLRWDAGGHGYHYQPTQVDAYVDGATGDTHPIAPPEIP